jgi:hypothetical protein
MQMTSKIKFGGYLDEEEKELIEGIEAAIDAGDIVLSTPAERKELNAHWQEIVRRSNERKAITLRVQTGDIERLKNIARRKGMPYQTLVVSVLHQYANGDLIERPLS